MSIEKEGGEFLHSINPTLHTQGAIEYEQERRRLLGRDFSQKPSEKINDWLEVIEKTHIGHRDRPDVMRRIKEYYHDKYVIKEENIPQNYWNSLAKLMIEEGRGGDLKQIGVLEETVKDKDGKEITNYIFPEDLKRQQAAALINDQITTLDKWVEYLTSPDSDVYPTWVKYWAFNGMVKLSRYDKEKKTFGTRDKTTVAPFVDLNREALAYVVDAVVRKARKENIPDEENNPKFKQLLQGANFGKLYAYAIERVTPTEQNKLKETRGEWVKYERGSDHMPLVNSIQGHGTGWCTAGESTAEAQLKGGDFYVYYSLDENGKATIPRVAIRMEGDKIAEVRGIAENQNLDPFINEVVDKKLKEFRDGDNYKKRVEDMKTLTRIDTKVKNGESLDKEDIKFLYEIESKIQGFGYSEDPRVEKIKKGRDVKGDLAFLFGCDRDEISTTRGEALKGDIVYHYGDLDLSDIIDITSPDGLKLPRLVGGSIDLSSLKSAEGLSLPESVGEHINLSSLESAKGLKLPKSVGGDIDLSELKSAEGLELPESVGGDINISSLKSAEGLNFPRLVGGRINLSGLESAEGLNLPESVGGDINLSGLESAKDLNLPESVGGSIYLSGLKSAEGLNFPRSVGGDIYLSGLESAEGLNLPESVGGSINLSSLESAKGLKLPKSVGRYINLSGLRSAEGLNLPESVGWSIDLSGLRSAEGLNLPESVGWSIDLSGLRSAEGLNLPESVGGSIYLSGLKSAEGLNLPESVGGDINLSGLESAEGLNFPRSVGGDINLSGLESAKDLNLPESVGNHINLSSLKSAEGLNLPESVGGSINLSRLESAKGLKLPKSVGRDIDLSGLRSAEGLNLPESVGLSIDLSSLKSAEGLNFPRLVGGSIDLSSLKSAEGLSLPESVGEHINLSSLKSAKGLKLPKSVGGDIDLSELKSAEGLELPESVYGDVYLLSLTSRDKSLLEERYPNIVIFYF